MYAEVNQMFGDIVKVTPSSQGRRRHGADDGGAGADPGAGRGPGGRGGLPRERRRHDARQPRPAAGGMAAGAAEEGAEGRDAADRPPRGGDAAGRPGQGCAPSSRGAAGEASDRQRGLQRIPDVSQGLHATIFNRHRDYGPVRTLPTPVYFYGMEPGQEISVEIDPGKIIEVRLQAVGETNEEGDVRGLLRAERPAAHRPGAEPQGAGHGAEAAEGGGRQPGPRRRADAGGDRQRGGERAASRCRRAT